MELLVLNTNLEAVDILDNFESVIWTGKYSEHGDFELYTKASDDIFSILRKDYYIWSKDSDTVMIIEDRKIQDDAENGDHVIITGPSLESILKRRIVWKQTVLQGSLQNGIQLLLNENAISPTNPDRVIPNLIFEASNDPAITSLTVDAQCTYTELYETIKALCDANNIGFKITLSDDNKFVFKLYSGKDRSYEQNTNPYVVFSSAFDNLISGNYSESQKKLKNVTLVAGEGEGSSRITTVVGSASGLSRRELYTDARDISQTVNGGTISSDDYIAQLTQRGTEKLMENGFDVTFDAKIDATRMFIYGRDFFLGDIVQLVSEYGIEARARITDIIMSQNTSGIDVYPLFTIL